MTSDAKRELSELRPAVEGATVIDPLAPATQGKPPRKYTPAVHKVIVDELRKGQRPHGACARAGITLNTFHDWIQKGKNGDPWLAEFVEDVEIAYNSAEASMVDVLVEAAGDREDRKNALDASKWLLERQRSDGYSKQVKTTVEKQIEQFLVRLEKALDPSVFEQVLAVYLGQSPTGGELGGKDAALQLTEHGTSEEYDDAEGE